MKKSQKSTIVVPTKQNPVKTAATVKAGANDQKPKSSLQTKGSHFPQPSNHIPNYTSNNMKGMGGGGSTVVIGNDYYDTLVHPESVVGVKIPTDDRLVTGVDHIVQPVFAEVSSGGVCGIILGGGFNGCYTSLIPSETQCLFGNGTTQDMVIGGVTGSSTLASAPFNTAATSAGVTPVRASGTSIGLFEQTMQGCRLVSMSLAAYSAASFDQMQGFVASGSFPKGAFESNPIQNQDVTTLVSNAWVKSDTISNGPRRCVYAPTDNTCFQYLDVERVYTSAHDANDQDVGGLMILFFDADPGTPILFIITYNYEFTPATGTFQTGLSRSIVDQDALDMALNKISVSQLTTQAEHGGDKSGMEKALVCTASRGTHLFGAVKGGQNVVTRFKTFKDTTPRGVQAQIVSADVQKTMLEKVGDFMLKMAKALAPELVRGVASLL